MKKLIFILLLINGFFATIQAETPTHFYKNVDKKAMNQWVDSVFDSMTNDERIGQLFMIIADPGPSWHNRILKNINEQKVGGILFSKGNLSEQAESINLYQKASRVPLFISFDGEWGLAMRLKDTPNFPKNMMLGAIQNNELLRLYGEEMGRQCNELGVHINFAPVLDVNVNPANPVIGTRSFGENQKEVALKGIAYSKGLENKKVMAVGKHFPGHGDTAEDSHKTLPQIKHKRERLDEVELYPFVQYIQGGFSGLMTGHLSVLALDNQSGLPTSLSPRIVTDLLQKELGFTGLSFTDALVMKGASNGKQSICVQALLAGNDVLLSPENPIAEFKAVKKAIQSGVLNQEIIEQKCLKILRYKYIAGLNQYTPIKTSGLKERLNSSYTKELIQLLNDEAITLLKNENYSIPLQNLGTKKIAVLSMGENKLSHFQETMSLYGGFDYFQLPSNASESTVSNTFGKLKNYDVIVCAIHTNKIPDYKSLQNLGKSKELHLCFFMSPYQIRKYSTSIGVAESVTLAYENTLPAQKSSAEIIMGGLPAKGKTPVSISNLFDCGTGIETQKVRLSYQSPRSVNMSGKTLKKIESVVNEGIEKKAFPGCQVLVAKNGVVVYNQSFGFFDYANTHEVQNSDIYDLASVTKAVATVPAIMKLYDSKKIRLDDKISQYVPSLKATDKENITIKRALFHETGLTSFIPFYMLLINPDSYEGNIYSRKRDAIYRTEYDKNTFMRNDFEFHSHLVSSKPSEKFPLQIAEHFYGSKAIKDSILSQIVHSKLRKNTKYLYSDLNFLLLQEVVENVTKQSLDQFVEKEFFAELGANYTTFSPLKKIDKLTIAPTENDEFLRNQLLIGYPHDEAAALLGGVAGNAGLFSNANDLAKILQMLLNNGSYGGKQYVSKTTGKLFTETKSPNSRRGLGFDKPDQTKDSRPACKQTSAAAYGHTGYTGTCFWVDPAQELIYIFLSNRVYPSRMHTQLMELNIRSRIQEIIYESIN